MLRLKSPAKINLFLRIIQRRLDGYHDLASLFQTIDLCDFLHFEESEKDNITCNCPSLPTDETNLVFKALRLFQYKTDINRHFSIHLEKNIPQQAGLGGGSSNAATTLWALNFLSGNLASEMELAAWGAELGSDISFFLSKGTAYCTGRGEIVRELPPLHSIALWVVKPHKGLSTPEVYGKLKISSLTMNHPEEILDSFFNRSIPIYINDLEAPAFEIMPELAILKKKLIKAGFSSVLMSGSGSSFFCVGNGNLSGLSDCKTFKTNFINREPNCWY